MPQIKKTHTSDNISSTRMYPKSRLKEPESILNIPWMKYKNKVLNEQVEEPVNLVQSYSKDNIMI